MKKQRSSTSIFFSLTILLVAIWIGVPQYLKKALIYQHPGIHDYPIFENRTVKSSASPIKWPVHAQYNQIQLNAQWIDTLERYESVAYLIIQNDSLLYETYWDNHQQETLSNSFSTAKSIVALLIGIAIDEGHIQSVDQKVIDFIPSIKGKFASSLTIKQLLTMSSGSSWDESYSSATSITTQAYYGNNLQKIIHKVRFDREPGKIFEYRSGDTQLLSMILAQATGRSVSEYASEKLWKPIGAQHDALWSLDHADGIEKAYCCFNSTARDFARIGTLILNHGKANDQQIVSESFLQSALAPATQLTDAEGQNVNYYGYQWWVVEYRNQTIPYTRGILGQYIFVLPAQNAVVVRLGHLRSDYRNHNHPTDIYAYIQAALEVIEKVKGI